MSPSHPEKTKNFSDKKKQATLAAPLLAGKPLQRRSALRRDRTLTPAAVSRGHGRSASPVARVVAAEEKVVAVEIGVDAVDFFSFFLCSRS